MSLTIHTHDRGPRCDRCRAQPAECVWEGNVEPDTGYEDCLILCAKCQPHWNGEIPPGYDDEELCKPDGSPYFPPQTRSERRMARLQAQADAGFDTKDWEDR